MIPSANARNPSAVWVGAILSALFLGLFLWLKYQDSSVLDLQPQWLLVAVVPLVASLVVGGYVRELKAGDYGVDFSAKEILAKSKPIPDPSSATATKFEQTSQLTDWRADRAKEYARTRGYMLAHIYRPSNTPGQRFDISIFVVRHEKGSATPPREQLDEIMKAEFFFGESWGNHVFEVASNGGFFGIRTHAWGTFLASCRITFVDEGKEPIVLYRYIDFSMATNVN
jgi:hypothetical protein